MTPSLLIVLEAGGHGLRLQMGQKEPAFANCPDIANDQKNVLFWGMLLDGKDHTKGKHAYDWHGFQFAYQAMHLLLTTEPDEPLEYEHLLKARRIVEKASGRFGWAKTALDYEGPVFNSYTCLECKFMKALVDDVPQEFFRFSQGKNRNSGRSNASCPDYKGVFLRPKPVSETQQKLKELLSAYNSDIEKLTTKKEKLVRLASYLKDFTFLHPWGNGNGRFRTMQLIHEVRRLGLGCGVFMYNNNKDLYFMLKKTYAEKIEEGIEMYERGMQTGTSPWLDADVVAKHKARFNPDDIMPGLSNCRKYEYTKTSYYFSTVDPEPDQVAGVVNMTEVE